MFITVKRHERETQELLAEKRLIDVILRHSKQGLFVLDGAGRMLPQVSKSLSALFRREQFSGVEFAALLEPLVSAQTLNVVRAHIVSLLRGDAAADRPLADVEVRLANSDGPPESVHYRFDFDPVDLGTAPKQWLVRVTDVTLEVLSLRELEELRSHTRTQAELLRAILTMGGARFDAFLKKGEAAMMSIDNVLKKPARAADAFRNKLEETLAEVGRMRLAAADFRLTALENAAQVFEDALRELRARRALSGGDFLPLTVKLDQLYGHFAVVKSLALSTGGGVDAPLVEAAGRPGSLDHTLQSLTEHVAKDENKQVTLECRGLESVPPRYRAAVKNVAIQLIRNAVMHGIEPVPSRVAAGKDPHGSLRLEFTAAQKGFELAFEDDGAGLDAGQVRATAITRGIVSAEAAARMRDRDAIKLIFKSRYTTLGGAPHDTAHGSGMSLVRRYVHGAGGKIALASRPGRNTRFKITLPRP